MGERVKGMVVSFFFRLRGMLGQGSLMDVRYR